MATALHHLVHEQPQVLLAMEPEELAGPVLQWLVGKERAPKETVQTRDNFLSQFKTGSVDIRKALVEAWVWLEREGCIARMALP